MFKEKVHKVYSPKQVVSKNNLWGIVLAGGEGTRLSVLSEKLYGYHRPKQYCTLVGSRSLLQHTIGRVRNLIPHEQILTVVNKNHEHYFAEELRDHPKGSIVVQPLARETTAGILFPMLKIHHKDPESVVSIFPADHFIEEELHFMNHVREAKLFVEQNPEAVVMLGVRPERTETGYGWIECGDLIEHNYNGKIFRVNKFWEKPKPRMAEMLFNQGCLINTFVLIGKSISFINHIKNYLPEVFNAFNAIDTGINSALENEFAEFAYANTPLTNFSTEVLEKISEHLYVMEINDVHWSDWGEEYRVLSDIERLKNRNNCQTVPCMENSYFKNSALKQLQNSGFC